MILFKTTRQDRAEWCKLRRHRGKSQILHLPEDIRHCSVWWYTSVEILTNLTNINDHVLLSRYSKGPDGKKIPFQLNRQDPYTGLAR